MPAPNGRSAPLSLLDRLRYQAQQRGLAALTFPGAALFHIVLNPDPRKQPPPPPPWSLLVLRRRYNELLAADLQNVEGGYYPKELLFGLPLRDYLRRAPEGLLDMPNIILRRSRGEFEDLPAGADTAKYPKYYLRNFHWQSDGWLSGHSARLYDPGVEFLFLGTADVQRRMVIPPVADAVEGARAPRVLDLACGTGRFLTQLHSALPGARLAGLDMSPDYVEFALEALAGVPADLRAANAEKTPYKPGSFDAVTSIFLFHELPKAVRRRVAREVRRILKPGGRFVVFDSAQHVESRVLAPFLDAFPELYHEPFYAGYLRDDLETMLEECGFAVEESKPFFVSKRVVAVKES